MATTNELVSMYGVTNSSDLMKKLGISFQSNEYVVQGQKFKNFEEALNFAHENYKPSEEELLKVEEERKKQEEYLNSLKVLSKNTGKEVFLTTTGVDRKHEVLDVVFVLHCEEAKGMLGVGGIDLDNAMNEAKTSLSKKARDVGADAIIGCDFEVRISNTSVMNKQVFEIYCFGTAVCFVD